MNAKAMKPYRLILLVLVHLVGQPVWAGEAVPVLTLDQAVEMALANHPALQMAKPAADMMQARIQGERAALYPKLTARFVVPFVGTESGVTLQQYIWDFRQTQHRIEASRAQARASGFEQAAPREDVILTVKVAYYTVLMQQLIKTEAEHRVHTLEKRLEQIDRFFNIGRRSKSELTQARMNLDQGKLSLATARHDVDSVRIELAAAMGLDTALPYELAPEIADDTRPIDLELELQSALAYRSELHHLDARIAALNAEAAAAKQSVYPTIFGRLAYRVEGAGAEQPGFVAGIGIQGTLFDGFATAAKMQEANAEVRHAKAEMAVKRQQITTEVKQAILRLQLAAEHIPLTQHSQREAKEHLQYVSEQFRLGRVSAIELAEAELLVASATAQHLQSIYTAKIALAQLERATGRDVDK